MLLNLVHIATGLPVVVFARTDAGAQSYLTGCGVAYLLIWVLGPLTIGGWLPLNTADNWLHLVTGSALLGLGLARRAGLVTDVVRELLVRVDAGELGDPLPVLAYLAGEEVEIPDEELNGARRRAVLLVAAGGDPHRELGVDDRAVRSLAADLFNDERRAQLGTGIDAVVLLVRELPTAREAALFLAADVDLAWRLFALGLLAEELAG